MDKFGTRRYLIGSLVLAAGCMLGMPAHAQEVQAAPIQAKALTPNIAISEQVNPASAAAVARQGYTTVIDLRPDGESADQPSSSEVGKAVRGQGLQFHYIPVANGAPISDAAVEQLAKALSGSSGPVLMYCRSGKRAARTWSLVEASRPGGMQPAEILAAVKAAGQPSDDLETQIRKRFAERATATGTAK
jgi:uncharacterized protein (TIGR01244 family)